MRLAQEVRRRHLRPPNAQPPRGALVLAPRSTGRLATTCRAASRAMPPDAGEDDSAEEAADGAAQSVGGVGEAEEEGAARDGGNAVREEHGLGQLDGDVLDGPPLACAAAPCA